MIKLKPRMLELLIESLKSNNRQELLWVIEQKELVDLDVDLANELREAVGDELIKRGLNKDDEPNKLGLELEDLIDILGRLAHIT